MNDTNEKLIRNFYEAFARRDADAMVSNYHDQIEFSDPAFGVLKGEDAKNMWRMLIERGKGNLKIDFANVRADGEKGSADWTADYLFSKTGRQVHNEVRAEFEFKDGKIFWHRDDFDFWNWSKQALGIIGSLLGWSSFMQNKIRQTARESLNEFAGKNK